MTTKGNAVAHWRGLLTSFVIMMPLLSSSVAGEPTSLPTEWICMYSPANAGSSLAIRRESPTGNIQCLAPDGRNCRWKTGAATSLAVCNAQLAGDVAATSNYLTCGPDHKAKYNSTGYEGSRSWCWEGSNIIPLSMPSPYICTQFKDLPSPNWAPVHRDAWRDIECLTANDGLNCLWSATKEECEAKYAANKDSKIQLSCGIDMKAKFDYTGYDKGPLHFCYIGNITLPDYHPVPNPSS